MYFHVQGSPHSLKSQIKRICHVLCPSFELVGLRGCNNLQLSDSVRAISPRWVIQRKSTKRKGHFSKHIHIIFFFCIVTTPTRTILMSVLLAREMEGKAALI